MYEPLPWPRVLKLPLTKPLTLCKPYISFLEQPPQETSMKYKFTANFNIEGKPITHAMEYDSVDIVKTLERRLKTAFPNATGITITLDGETPTPRGVK